MTHLYEALANLLEYPGGDLYGQIELCTGRVESSGHVDSFLAFRRKVEALDISTLQEQYTQTFDLNPVCALEVGYHLFGENYKRGVFLANLRETEAPFALGQEHQLPDYLPVLLRLLPKLDDEELRISLIAECLLPAVEKMLDSLSSGESPYCDLIRVVGGALEAEIPGSYSRSASPRARTAADVPGLYQIRPGVAQASAWPGASD